ncbi:hypothetical protein H4J45_16475 [Colwellia sp. BRX10-6]|nr:hypothetical protein [Colwellia sp. BRX10-6]
MKTLTKLALVLIPTITLSMTATAHDPKLHAKKAEKADCSKMDHIDRQYQQIGSLAYPAQSPHFHQHLLCVAIAHDLV